ncbi:MAG: ATP-binding cassette domain-containing protein [Dethiobacteria bacterium]
MQPIIQVNNLIKKYRMGNEVVSVLNGIDLQIYPGEILSILGTSGSGKTTFLNLVSGLERPTKGKIMIDGHNLNKIREKRYVRLPAPLHRLRFSALQSASCSHMPWKTPCFP